MANFSLRFNAGSFFDGFMAYAFWKGVLDYNVSSNGRSNIACDRSIQGVFSSITNLMFGAKYCVSDE